MMRRLLLLLVAACASAEDQPARLADFPGITAISVSLPELPNREGVKTALVAAMDSHDLPTYFDGKGPKSSYLLKITGAPPNWHFSLSDSAGREIGAFDTALTPMNGDPIAERVSGLLLPAPPVPPQPNLAHIAVVQGEGAPGDGDAALARAMTQMMTGKVLLDPAPAETNYTVRAKVGRKSAKTGDVIALDWILSDPKGRQIAHIEQSNSVPAGSLDKNWGGVAYDAALAAARSLIPIVAKLPPSPPE